MKSFGISVSIFKFAPEEVENDFDYEVGLIDYTQYTLHNITNT